MRHIVEIKTNGAWAPYREGRKFREESSAYRLLDRLQARWPNAELRVTPVTASRKDAGSIPAAQTESFRCTGIAPGVGVRLADFR